MKYTISFLTLLALLSFKTSSTLQECGDTPEMNKQIIQIVNSKMNTKVGRGECWDLAAEALKGVNAKWDGMYIFGKEVNYKKECIFAGDIIQFERIKLKYTKNGISYVEEMTHHTAIIYEVKSKGIYKLAHQNTTETGKKVGLSEMDVNDVTKGKFKIYRPEM